MKSKEPSPPPSPGSKPASEPAARESHRLFRVYLFEACSTLAANFLMTSIYFYTRSRLGFSTRQNLVFSASIGVIYIVSSLASHHVARWFGPKRSLVGIAAISGLIALLPLLFHSATACCVAVGGFVLILSMTWPILEHLIATGPIGVETLARRLTIYNLIWSSTGVLGLAVGGTVIDHFPRGMFWLPGGLCGICALIAMFTRIEPEAHAAVHSPLDPDPQLITQRRLALLLARISVPAMYVVTYALVALMPSIPVLQPYSAAKQTLISSGWFAVRTLMFLILGSTRFWHTRPQLLLVAGAALLAAFVMIVVPFSRDQSTNLAVMFMGQLILGVSVGLIYMCSLYFGMALTSGSAESGGYHEALVGVGMTLGPGAAAAMEFIRPHDQPAAVAAVSAILGATVLVGSVMSLRMRRHAEPSV